MLQFIKCNGGTYIPIDKISSIEMEVSFSQNNRSIIHTTGKKSGVVDFETNVVVERLREQTNDYIIDLS